MDGIIWVKTITNSSGQSILNSVFFRHTGLKKTWGKLRKYPTNIYDHFHGIVRAHAYHPYLTNLPATHI